MKVHFGGLGDHAKSIITTKNGDLARALTVEDMKKKKEHNQTMLEIASTLSYTKFDDIKGLYSAKKMWDSLYTIYGGDTNILRAKSKSLRGNFDDMKC